jgi:hypothetical protein
MKKVFNIVLGLTTLVGMVSCEDFFKREPINEFSAETYFASEAELQMYADGFLNAWLPDYSEPSGGDAYNDLIATKTSTDFFRADVIWDAAKQGSWSWTWLRRINYMLTNMVNAKGAVSDDIYNHYEGVARFWRAYQYFSKVKNFSDVPWTDKYLQPEDSDILYGARDDREFVFSKMVEDMEFARQHVMAGKFTDGNKVNIDSWVVNAFASRMYLYEASFRANYPTNPSTGKEWSNQYNTVQQLYTLAAEAAKHVIDNSPYSLSTGEWSDLFLANALNKDEVIWGKTYLNDINGRHNLTRYFNSSTLGQQYSGTKELVRMFLKADGTPVETGEQTIVEEFQNRDPRLAKTVLGPGFEIQSGANKIFMNPNLSFCRTGYMLVKWVIRDDSHFQNSIDENSLSIIRYPEVLLNYAEAMNELKQMSEEIWNMTVGAIRKRVGLPAPYPTAPDQWLNEYYTKDLTNKHVTDGNLAVALEIRRERVTELTFEGGLRQSDLYRWGQADLVSRRGNKDYKGWTGLWLTQNDVNSGFLVNSKLDETGKETCPTYLINEKQAKDSENTYKISTSGANSTWSLQPAGSGYYVVYHYDLRWEDRMYCRPIPTTASNLNANLGQNYGW